MSTPTPSIWKFNGDLAADLGISGIRRTCLSQAAGSVTFMLKQASCAAAAPFDYGDTVTITKDGATWFIGRVTSVPRMASPSSEYIQYTLADPWWYLENIVYQQSWQMAAASQNKSRYILGQSATGARQNSGQVIADVLAYAAACGAPITAGTIDPEVNIPLEEGVDTTCAEIIRRLLRWSPDCVTWFEYTSDDATLHIRKRANLTAKTIPALSGSPSHGLDITARPDLQIPAVIIYYEKTESVSDPEIGEIEYEKTETDAYPTTATGREIGALVATINLKGGKIAYLSQKIKTREIENAGYTPASTIWWRDHLPCLENVGHFKVLSHQRGQTELNNELLEGQIQDWMEKDSVTETIKATVEFSNDGLLWLTDMMEKEVYVKITATNATSQTYKTVSSSDIAELAPVGLAKAIYDAASQLHYQGQLILKENEVSGSAGMGNVINLSGGRSSWASMRAMIQQTVEDVDMGVTTITFGPPMHLGPGDLVELLRANRRRKESGGYSLRITGKSNEGPGVVSLGGKTPLDSASSGPPRYSSLVVQKNGKIVRINAEQIPSAVSGLQIRELNLTVDGSPKKVALLCSAPY